MFLGVVQILEEIGILQVWKKEILNERIQLLFRLKKHFNQLFSKFPFLLWQSRFTLYRDLVIVSTFKFVAHSSFFPLQMMEFIVSVFSGLSFCLILLFHFPRIQQLLFSAEFLINNYLFYFLMLAVRELVFYLFLVN